MDFACSSRVKATSVFITVLKVQQPWLLRIVMFTLYFLAFLNTNIVLSLYPFLANSYLKHLFFMLLVIIRACERRCSGSTLVPGLGTTYKFTGTEVAF